MFGGGNIGMGITIGVGIAGAQILANKLESVLPASWKTDPNIVRIGSKAAIGIGLPLVLKHVKILPPKVAQVIAYAGVAAAVLDIIATYVAPKLNLTMGEYQPGMLTGMETGGLSEYQEGTLSDLSPGPSGGAYGGGAYGDMLTGF